MKNLWMVGVMLGLIGALSACSKGDGTRGKSRTPTPAAERARAGGPGAPAIAAFGATPTTFQGVRPCADCPGIETTLNVWPDGIYYLRQVYLERPGQFDEIGRWDVSQADSLLYLRGGGESPRLFHLLDGATLRDVPHDGSVPPAGRDDLLRRVDPFAPFEPQLRLRAIYQSIDAGGFLRDCVTQRPVRILPGATATALNDAYLKADAGRDAEMAVVVEARYVTRPVSEGAGQENAVVVEQVFEILPGEECAPRASSPDLEERFWRVTQIGARPVGNLAASRRVPGFRLSRSGNRLIGFSTCNRIMGGYELDGASLRFSAVAATRTACKDGMAFEAELLKVIETTRSWRLDGDALELRDVRGATLARFTAVLGE